MAKSLIVIGSGPGGYVAAIRASQLGFSVTVIEKAELGGVCLNWGCIPTKSLLKSADVLQYAKNASHYGIDVEGTVKPNFSKIIQRSRQIASQMSKGIEYLFSKNNITVVKGKASFKDKNTIINCSRLELNQRPLDFQSNALPLSYLSFIHFFLL